MKYRKICTRCGEIIPDELESSFCETCQGKISEQQKIDNLQANNDVDEKFLIIRKDDNYAIESNDINFVDAGIWIKDDIETGDKNVKVFIPYSNILQINKHIITKKERERGVEA